MIEFKDGRPTLVDPSIPDGKYYSQREFAKTYDIPHSTVRVWIHRGIIPHIDYYGRKFIPENVKFYHKYPWMRQLQLNQLRKKTPSE